MLVLRIRKEVAVKRKFWNFANSETGRTLTLSGSIAEESWFEDDVTPEAFAKDLNSGSGDITLWINSPGGDCIAAAQIYNMLKEYPGAINVKIDAIAASAASVIAMAGDNVAISPVGMLMIHNPQMFAMGDHNDMALAQDMLNEVKESIINAYELKSKLSRDEISQMMENETWMNANKALELGFVDEIIGAEKQDEEEKEPKEEGEEKKQEIAQNMIYSQRVCENNLAQKIKNLVDSEKLDSPRKRLELLEKI